MDDVKLAVLQSDMNNIKEKVNSIDEKLGRNYVSQEEFRPIKVFVWGFMGLILTLLGTVIINSGLKH